MGLPLQQPCGRTGPPNSEYQGGLRTMAENRQGTAGKSGRPFQKGRSGNPGGRPKVEGEIRALAQQHGPAALKRLVQLMGSKNERAAIAAAQAVLDRAYGKPPQAIDLGGDENRPARLVITYLSQADAEASHGDDLGGA
jgi:hypothetical protein